MRSEELELRLSIARAAEQVLPAGPKDGVRFEHELHVWSAWESGPSGHCLEVRAVRGFTRRQQDQGQASFRIELTRRAEFVRGQDGQITEVKDGTSTRRSVVRSFSSLEEAFAAFQRETEQDPLFRLEKPEGW